VGAAGSDPGRNLEQLHDVQAGNVELDPAGRLAGHWTGCVFQLQRKAQPGAGSAEGQWPVIFIVSRRMYH
jgi:hypothetical protein